MKLTLRILFYTICSLLLFIAAIHFTLVYYVSSESVRVKIVSMLQEELNTEVNIGNIDASIFDFEVDNIEIKLNNENFVYINKAYLHFYLIDLIVANLNIRRITIDTITLYITRNEDGSFNFEKLLESPMFAKEETDKQAKDEDNKDDSKNGSLIDILLHRTQFQNISCLYTDKLNNINASLTDTYFNINNFEFDNTFKITLYSKLYALINGIEIDSVSLGLKIHIDLEDMQFDKATIKIDNIQTRYKDFLISCTGNITNFIKPEISLDIKLKDLSSNLLNGITEVPEFLIPLIEISTNITADLENNLINLNNFNVNMLTSTMSANGYMNYSKNEYKFDISIDLILNKLSKIAKTISDAKPQGKIISILSISNKNIAGKISLEEVGLYTDFLGYFRNINSIINIANLNDIKMKKLTGFFNKNPFYCDFSYLVNKNCGYITTNFKADKFIAQTKIVNKNNKKEDLKQPQKTNNNTTANEKKSKWNLPPFKIKSTCDINFLDVPFLKATNLKFKMDLSDVTPTLQNAHGHLNLNTIDGTIKDIYKLTNANMLTKSLFMSLKIISDVINALNVLDLLNSIGSALSSSKEKEQISEEENTNQKIDGKMDFDSFITNLNFDKGKGIFEQCNFVSSLLSFKVSGDIDFKQDIIDMTVNAAPGKHELDGTMPLTMKITGTTEQPEGSLSLLGSVSNLVGDLLTKNAVTGNLRKGFTSLFGLKKHDEQGNDIKEEKK